MYLVNKPYISLQDIWSTMKDSICEESDIIEDEYLKDTEMEIQKLKSQMIEITKSKKAK